MESNIVYAEYSYLRVVTGIFYLLLPALYSVFVLWKSPFKQIAKAVVCCYLWCFVCLVVYLFVPPMLWSLEGEVSEELFIQLTDPYGQFLSALDWIILAFAVAGTAVIPAKLKQRWKV